LKLRIYNPRSKWKWKLKMKLKMEMEMEMETDKARLRLLVIIIIHTNLVVSKSVRVRKFSTLVQENPQKGKAHEVKGMR
jgi:hypothetical protein